MFGRKVVLYFIICLMVLISTTNIFAESSAPRDVDTNALWQAWKIVTEESYDRDRLSQKELLYGAIRGVVKGTGDRHAYFFPKKEFERFLEKQGGTGELRAKSITDKMVRARISQLAT